MKKEKRVCAVCGKKFLPKAANQIVCSAKCKKIRKVGLARDRRNKAKAPVKATATEKIALPKPKKGAVKEVKKDAKNRKKTVTSRIDIVAGSPYEVVTIALYIAFNAIGKLLKEGRLGNLK